MLEPAEFLELLRRRRSRRYFTDQVVEPEKLERALQAAMRAPSGANTQPWEYVLVQRGPVREKLRELCEAADRDFHKRSPEWLKAFFADHSITPVKEFAATVPLIVAVFGHRDLPFWLQSVWLSIGNFINALEAEGLHSLTYTPSVGREFNRLLGVDDNLSCQAVIPVGYGDPGEQLKARPRKGPAEKARMVSGDGKVKPFDASLLFEP